MSWIRDDCSSIGFQIRKLVEPLPYVCVFLRFSNNGNKVFSLGVEHFSSRSKSAILSLQDFKEHYDNVRTVYRAWDEDLKKFEYEYDIGTKFLK